jgi:RNA polymerase subunit RPABC4/transcription elongation factor Spt4
MSKEKACLNCKVIFSEANCPICGETSFTDSYKGKIYIFNSEKSEVAQKMKLNKNGLFAIKTK